MELSLLPPQNVQERTGDAIDRLESDFQQGKVKISSNYLTKLEKEIRVMVDRWKEGTSVLKERLQKWNDLMEGVTEEQDFPWTGASRVTMGTAAGSARTLAATFDRSLFSQESFLVAENNSAATREKAKTLEDSVNWLGSKVNNLLDVLRDMPIPLFRDGTVPVMGEWKRQVEKAVDYKTYQTSAEFMADYPSPEAAGMDEKKYSKTLKYLDKTYNPDLSVEYIYDEVIYDAPHFTKIPLARFIFHPLSAEELGDCVIYGRQFFEHTDTVETKIKYGEYDEEPGKEAIVAASGMIDDVWGHNREAIEGLSSEGDNFKRCECYRLVLKKDIDGDRVPEKYLLTYEHQSHRILKIQRYNLRRNIDNVVIFRFLKRDGRLLGVSLCGDGYDQFRMIDDFHRHRQNVRAITDAPAFIAPERLKDTIDFGSGDYAWRPGVTLYLPDEYMGDKAPRQMVTQNLDRTNNSLDEEGSVMRYLEIRLGPSQGMSGKETINDPKQPATKTLALLRQSTFRIDHYINEFKRSVPLLVKLHNALYYQYGPRSIKYMGKVKDSSIELEMEKALFALDSLSFNLKIGELALSPEYQMEKAQALLQAALANPIVMQMKPQILIEAWNEMVYAVKPLDLNRFLIEAPKPGMQQLPQMMGAIPPGVPQILAEKLQAMKGQQEQDITGGLNANAGK